MPRTKKMDCPYCGYQIDAATHASSDDSIAPAKGDLSICLKCAGFLVFGDTKLEKLSDEEFKTLPEEVQSQLSKLKIGITRMRENEVS